MEWLARVEQPLRLVQRPLRSARQAFRLTRNSADTVGQRTPKSVTGPRIAGTPLRIPVALHSPSLRAPTCGPVSGRSLRACYPRLARGQIGFGEGGTRPPRWRDPAYPAQMHLDVSVAAIRHGAGTLSCRDLQG